MVVVVVVVVAGAGAVMALAVAGPVFSGRRGPSAAALGSPRPHQRLTRLRHASIASYPSFDAHAPLSYPVHAMQKNTISFRHSHPLVITPSRSA